MGWVVLVHGLGFRETGELDFDDVALLERLGFPASRSGFRFEGSGFMI